jgi:hypothetical protein
MLVEHGQRAVAQLGSALDWGSRGREFKSRQPDHIWPSDGTFPKSERSPIVDTVATDVATGMVTTGKHLPAAPQPRAAAPRPRGYRCLR